MSRLRTCQGLGQIGRYCTLLAAVTALVVGVALVVAGTANPPAAQAKPINPYVPCSEWQAMHPGWPCWGNFPEIEEPVLPGAPGQPSPAVPAPQTFPGVPQPLGPPPPPATALTPPTPGPNTDPCNAIIPVPGYIPPALPGNVPNAACGSGEDRPQTGPTRTLPLQSAGLCPLGRNPDGSCRGHGALNGSGSKVEIPEDYIFDPNCERVPEGRSCDSWVFMHDYCSGSPDQLPAPGANADFRGPCARHDMCLESGGTNNFCNNQLFLDMKQNCEYTYGAVDPRYQFCLANAGVYWDVVSVIQPPLPGQNGPWGN